MRPRKKSEALYASYLRKTIYKNTLLAEWNWWVEKNRYTCHFSKTILLYYSSSIAAEILVEIQMINIWRTNEKKTTKIRFFRKAWKAINEERNRWENCIIKQTGGWKIGQATEIQQKEKELRKAKSLFKVASRSNYIARCNFWWRNWFINDMYGPQRIPRKYSNKGKLSPNNTKSCHIR